MGRMRFHIVVLCTCVGYVLMERLFCLYAAFKGVFNGLITYVNRDIPPIVSTYSYDKYSQFLSHHHIVLVIKLVRITSPCCV